MSKLKHNFSKLRLHDNSGKKSNGSDSSPEQQSATPTTPSTGKTSNSGSENSGSTGIPQIYVQESEPGISKGEFFVDASNEPSPAVDRERQFGGQSEIRPDSRRGSRAPSRAHSPFAGATSGGSSIPHSSSFAQNENNHNNSSPIGKKPGAERSSRPPSIQFSLHPNESSTSLSKKHILNPAPSFLELKRFFGKGRKRHEHGVSHSEATANARDGGNAKKPVKFNIFGNDSKSDKDKHDKAKYNKSNASTPDHNHDSVGGYFSRHFGGKKHAKERSKPHKSDHGSVGDTAGKFVDATSGQEVKVKGAPPADLDPNFVVHAPDYEAEWDPFHLFGEDHTAEDRLPFLESRITMYGEMGRNVGSGAGGSVRMMERPSDHKIFAVKEFRARRSTETPQKYAKHVAAEYALGAALHHKNIIETIDLIKEGDKYYEVMEYGPHDFFELVMSGTMNTAQVNSSFAQILSGVAYLHSIGVAHRDLKLDNCVVTDEGVVKIIDFGSSVIFKYPMSPQIHLARGIMGSDPYLAPEVFYRHPYQPQYADVWSCGIIYACTYMRRFPWRLPQKEDVSFKKFAANPSNVYGQSDDSENPKRITGPWRLLRLLPSESRHLIHKMLMIDVKDRIDMEKVVEDQWYKSINQISVMPQGPGR